MVEWKKVVLVIKKEDLLFSEIPCKDDITAAWNRYVTEFELNPFNIALVHELKSKRKEFKRTWHVTVTYLEKVGGNYED